MNDVDVVVVLALSITGMAEDCNHVLVFFSFD